MSIFLCAMAVFERGRNIYLNFENFVWEGKAVLRGFLHNEMEKSWKNKFDRSYNGIKDPSRPFSKPNQSSIEFQDSNFTEINWWGSKLGSSRLDQSKRHPNPLNDFLKTFTNWKTLWEWERSKTYLIKHPVSQCNSLKTSLVATFGKKIQKPMIIKENMLLISELYKIDFHKFLSSPWERKEQKMLIRISESNSHYNEIYLIWIIYSKKDFHRVEIWIEKFILIYRSFTWEKTIFFSLWIRDSDSIWWDSCFISFGCMKSCWDFPSEF